MVAATTDAGGAARAVREVLVIEEQPEVRYLFRKLLANTPYTLREAINGVEGLTRVQTAPPHLICLDLMLPDRDGFSVLAQLKNDPHTRHIPIVVVTDKPLPAETEEQLTRHATLLAKSALSRTVLLAALQQARQKG